MTRIRHLIVFEKNSQRWKGEVERRRTEFRSDNYNSLPRICGVHYVIPLRYKHTRVGYNLSRFVVTERPVCVESPLFSSPSVRGGFFFLSFAFVSRKGRRTAGGNRGGREALSYVSPVRDTRARARARGTLSCRV